MARCARVIQLGFSVPFFIGCHCWYSGSGFLLFLSVHYHSPCLSVFCLITGVLCTSGRILLHTASLLRSLTFLTTAFRPAVGPHVLALVAIKALDIVLLALLLGVGGKSLVLHFAVVERVSIILINSKLFH
jgi:hypothetical protein